MIFPIGDDNVIGGHKPMFTYAFLALNVLIFLLQLSVEGNLICEYGAIPADIASGKNWYTVISSMFLHGGWMHLIGNMLFLWVFADNIEAVIGPLLFVGFYFLGGIAASLAHFGFNLGEVAVQCCTICGGGMPCGNSLNIAPCAGTVPTVGASGAISAVLGAYLVMFPRSQIKILVLVVFRTFTIAAIIFLGLWIGQQLISGFMSLGPKTSATSGGVAWWAHIGGFVFGVLAGFVFRKMFPKIDVHKEVKPITYEARRKGF